MKLCRTCDEEKPFTEFHRRGNGYQNACKSCRKMIDQAAYEKNKDKILEQKRVASKRLRQWYHDLKRDRPCADCGGTFHPAAMQWDHLPEYEKASDVAKLLVDTKSKRRVLDEIAKCELVCANCHAIRTWTRMTS